MAKETIQLTRTIQLKVDAPTKEERKEALVTLYRWQNRSYRAANLIITHLYIQEMIKEFFYLSEGIRYKLVDEKKDEAGLLNRSRMNSIYRVKSVHILLVIRKKFQSAHIPVKLIPGVAIVIGTLPFHHMKKEVEHMFRIFYMISFLP